MNKEYYSHKELYRKLDLSKHSVQKLIKQGQLLMINGRIHAHNNDWRIAEIRSKVEKQRRQGRKRVQLDRLLLVGKTPLTTV